jgi:hypothetical protein
MNRKDKSNYEMLTRVVNFTTTNVGLFPEESAAGEIIRGLESGVKALSEAAVARNLAEAAIREARAVRTAARDDVKNLIGRAELVARALHPDKVRAPRNGSVRELITIGRSFTVDVESMKPGFVRHGFPIDRVATSVDALETAAVQYAAANSSKSGAIRGWDAAMRGTLDTLISLDALVATALEDKPEAMASYESARTIKRTRGRKPAAVTAPEPPAVPAAANAAVA